MVSTKKNRSGKTTNKRRSKTNKTLSKRLSKKSPKGTKIDVNNLKCPPLKCPPSFGGGGGGGDCEPCAVCPPPCPPPPPSPYETLKNRYEQRITEIGVAVQPLIVTKSDCNTKLEKLLLDMNVVNFDPTDVFINNIETIYTKLINVNEELLKYKQETKTICDVFGKSVVSLTMGTDFDINKVIQKLVQLKQAVAASTVSRIATSIPTPVPSTPNVSHVTVPPSFASSPIPVMSGSIASTYEPYTKMKRIRGEESTKSQMVLDNFSQEEIDAFMSGYPIERTSLPKVAKAAVSIFKAPVRKYKYEAEEKIIDTLVEAAKIEYKKVKEEAEKKKQEELGKIVTTKLEDDFEQIFDKKFSSLDGASEVIEYTQKDIEDKILLIEPLLKYQEKKTSSVMVEGKVKIQTEYIDKPGILKLILQFLEKATYIEFNNKLQNNSSFSKAIKKYMSEYLEMEPRIMVFYRNLENINTDLTIEIQANKKDVVREYFTPPNVGDLPETSENIISWLSGRGRNETVFEILKSEFISFIKSYIRNYEIELEMLYKFKEFFETCVTPIKGTSSEIKPMYSIDKGSENQIKYNKEYFDFIDRYNKIVYLFAFVVSKMKKIDTDIANNPKKNLSESVVFHKLIKNVPFVELNQTGFPYQFVQDYMNLYNKHKGRRVKKLTDITLSKNSGEKWVEITKKYDKFSRRNEIIDGIKHENVTINDYYYKPIRDLCKQISNKRLIDDETLDFMYEYCRDSPEYKTMIAKKLEITPKITMPGTESTIDNVIETIELIPFIISKLYFEAAPIVLNIKPKNNRYKEIEKQLNTFIKNFTITYIPPKNLTALQIVKKITCTFIKNPIVVKRLDNLQVTPKTGLPFLLSKISVNKIKDVLLSAKSIKYLSN